MAQITICDICETRDNVNRKCYPYDRQPDRVGSSEDVCEMFDLCLMHENLALSRALKAVLRKDIKTEYDMNKLIISEIKKMIFARKLQKNKK